MKLLNFYCLPKKKKKKTNKHNSQNISCLLFLPVYYFEITYFKALNVKPGRIST